MGRLITAATLAALTALVGCRTDKADQTAKDPVVSPGYVSDDAGKAGAPTFPAGWTFWWE